MNAARGAVIFGVLLGFAGAVQAEQVPGLLVKLYDVGVDLRSVPELVAGQTPNHVRTVPMLDLVLDRGDFGDLREHFVTEVRGLLRTTAPGSYRLRLRCDDGALLWLNGRLLIDHDGLHGPEPKDSAPFELPPGDHALYIRHFQAGAGAQLTLEWATPEDGPDAFSLVPADALWHTATPTPQTSPGRKHVIPALRRGRPGDGRPLTGLHPAFRRVPRGAQLDPYLLSWFKDGRLSHMGTPRPEGAGPVVVWLPPEERPYPYGVAMPLLGATYADHVAVWLVQGGEAKRIVVVDDGAAPPQGVVFRFGMGGPSSMVESGDVAFELRDVRALANGLELEFTQPLDPRVGWETEAYYLEQWPFDLRANREPQRDGRVYPVKSATVSEDRRQVFLETDELRTSHVVYLRLLPPCVSEQGALPWTTEAWLTLNALPVRRGTPRPAPPTEPQNILSPEQVRAGWRLLFDGRTTAGWRGWRRDTAPAGWEVRDGCLVRVGPGGDICTEDQFENFELVLEWRISPGGNSGIFFRASEERNHPWETGPEMQVLDNAEHADGRSPLTSAGADYALYAPLRDVTRPVGLFNEARIRVQGAQVEYWLNGERIVQYEIGSEDWERRVAGSKFSQMPGFGRAPRGHVVLQDHGDRVWYRNIRIRELPPGESDRKSD